MYKSHHQSNNSLDPGLGAVCCSSTVTLKLRAVETKRGERRRVNFMIKVCPKIWTCSSAVVDEVCICTWTWHLYESLKGIHRNLDDKEKTQKMRDFNRFRFWFYLKCLLMKRVEFVILTLKIHSSTECGVLVFAVLWSKPMFATTFRC